MSFGPYPRVLALETSTPVGGVALLDGPRLVSRWTAQMGGSHSRRLLADVHLLLQREGLTVGDLDLIVASLGPGSFTGMRIGLATLKGLAFASGVPVAGASSLLCMAQGAALRDGLVAPALDARKREVYSAVYRCSGGEVEALTDEVVEGPGSWAERVAQLADGEPVVWLGQGARVYAEVLLEPCAAGSRVAGTEWDGPDPAQLALLGRRNAEINGPADLEALEPNYIRPSEAELGRRAAATSSTRPS